MRPRTVILTLELQDCTAPLALLRKVKGGHELGFDGLAQVGVVVAQATATVAQPSTASAPKRPKNKARGA